MRRAGVKCNKAVGVIARKQKRRNVYEKTYAAAGSSAGTDDAVRDAAAGGVCPVRHRAGGNGCGAGD